MRHKRPSIGDVARLAGVGISSVSRVLSGHPDVSADMRERVQYAVRQLDYKPDFLAQSLRRGATRSVGYVVSDFSNPVVASITSGAESVLREVGLSMLLMNSENDPTLDAAHIRFFQDRRVDGMILSLADERREATLDAITGADVPMIMVDRDVPDELNLGIVRHDHRSGMRTAVDHLLDLGHRRIALITGGMALWPVRERVAGMVEAVRDRGVPDETTTLVGSLSATHGERSTEQVLAMHPRPTAIVAGGNQVLSGCIRAFTRHGISAPRDMSLVTCDEVDLSELYLPPIAVIERDTELLGRAAAQMLLDQLSGGTPSTTLLPTRFVPRASCGPVPMTQATPQR